jgi:hypothetical protein
MMSNWPRLTANVMGIVVVAGLLGACSTFSLPSFGGSDTAAAPPAPPPAPDIPASIRRDEVVGKWGYAAYHRPEDRARTEAAAKNQCKNPYVIGSGPTGGVMMHLADDAQQSELRLKGSQDGRNYIGPPGPPGGPQDREIISFDGRVMIMNFIDSDAASRYGISVYVRCAPRA